jgi:transcriptional regulator with XRE-family HTH domain
MHDVSITQQFGLLIRKLRRRSGYSQEAFAEQCGLHRTYIGAIERGEKTVTIETANKLAHALSIPLSQLFLHLEAQIEGYPNEP